MGRLRSASLLIPVGIALGALALLWAARDSPLPALPLLLIDALGALFAAALALGLALAAARAGRDGVRPGGMALLFGAACLCASPPLLAALLFGGVALAGLPALQAHRYRSGLPALVGGLAALAAGAVLALRGAMRYDSPNAGAALDAAVFWLTLLAAAIPAFPLAQDHEHPEDPAAAIARAASLFPLVRLFSLGPWSDAWSLAAVLLGSWAALWCGITALTGPHTGSRADAARRLFLGAALASFGLASSAGVAAGCFALLCYVVLPHGATGRAPGWAGWVIAGALPLSAPFVAAWMAIGAAAAAGSIALAAALWFAALLRGVAALIEPPWAEAGTATDGGVVLALGVLAPPITLLAIQPVVEQLQGGLTAYGGIAIAPWIGLALRDSGGREVATTPTLAVSGLMVVLIALLTLIAQIRPKQPTDLPDVPEETMPATDQAAWRAALRREVPWLGGQARERRDDGD